jgi:hypothetical protein
LIPAEHRQLVHVHEVQAFLTNVRVYVIRLHVGHWQDVAMHRLGQPRVLIKVDSRSQTSPRICLVVASVVVTISSLHVEASYPVEALEAAVVSARRQNVKHTILLLRSNHLSIGDIRLLTLHLESHLSKLQVCGRD